MYVCGVVWSGVEGRKQACVVVVGAQGAGVGGGREGSMRWRVL